MSDEGREEKQTKVGEEVREREGGRREKQEGRRVGEEE